MNQNKYEFFSFNEINFSSEKKRLLGFLDNGGNIQSLKPFPPCVLKNNTGIVLVDKEIVLSQKDFLVNHNLFFGKEYVKINKAFKNSPYISATCKKCKYFKNLFCRGLFNNKFLNDQGRIIEARGQRQYYALAVEYSYGKLICSSRCNFNCYFCGQEKEKIRPFSVFVEPELSVKEILHFIHYAPSYGINSTLSEECCTPGEPLLHKDIKKILKIIKSFNLGSFWITTNGFFLNDELLDLISNLGYSLVLSLHSTNQDTRKRLMGYKEVIDVKGLVENILARNIELRPSIVALKETILNGDLKSTLLYLREKGIKPRILSNLFDVHGSKAKAENIGYDNNLLVGLLNEWGLCDYVELESSITQKRILDFANLFRDYLTKFDKESKILGLYPDFFFSALESSLQGVRNVHVVGLRTNIEGNAKLNTSWSRSLPIDTFLDVLKTNHEFDTVIIPKCSFNLFMDDIKGQNINGLVSKIDKKVILFG